MDKNGLINAWKKIGSLVVSVGVSLAAFAIGLYTADGGAWAVACYVFGLALVALAIVNVVLHAVTSNRMSAMRAKEGHDFALRHKEEIERDYDGAEKKVKRTIIIAYAYAAFVLVLSFLFCFSLGRLGPDAGFTAFLIQVVLLAVDALMMWGVWYMFIAVPIAAPPETNFILDKNEYPQLYAVAKSAASAAGCGALDMVLYDLTDGISVTSCGKTVYINVDYAEVAVLTRDELFNVMLHEFAHVVHDFKRGRFFRRALARTSAREDTRNPFIKAAMYAFLSYSGDKVQLAVIIFDTVSSRSFEQRADEMICRAGDKQTYADACAKIDGFFQYNNMGCREISYDFYEPEQPINGFASRVVEMYYVYRDKYADVWKERMLRELPANVDSHPTTRMRLEALGVTEFDAKRAETDPAYIAEMEKLLKSRDDIVYKRMTEEKGYYDDFRRGAYVTRKAAMDEYNEVVAKGEKPSEPCILNAVRAFIGIDNDKALEAVDMALALDPDAPRANYFKGVILADRFDSDCVDCFKRAAKYCKLADSAYDRIGQFALKSGDEELLAEYRADVCDVVQNADDILEKIGAEFNAKTKLEPHGLDDNTVSELARRMTKRCEGIGKIYVCKYVDSNGTAHYPVCVGADTNKIHTAEEFYELLSSVVDFLNFYSDEHEFFCSCDFDGLARNISNVSGAKIFDVDKKD